MINVIVCDEREQSKLHIDHVINVSYLLLLTLIKINVNFLIDVSFLSVSSHLDRDINTSLLLFTFLTMIILLGASSH